MTTTRLPRTILIGIGVAAVAFPAITHAQIVQTVNSANTTSEWNDAIWGSPAAPPNPLNQYQSASGLATSSSTALGTNTNVTGRVRAYGGASGNPVFGGDSLTLVPGTELLVKTGDTFTADLILNGGILRFSGDSAGLAATMTGTINVSAGSVLGVAQTGSADFTIASSLTGSSALRLAAGQGGSNNRITFDDGMGLSLNSYGGTLNIGGGDSRAIIDFNQPYVMSLAGMTMGTATLDVLNLDANIAVGSFSFAGTPLSAGTYTTTALESTFGTTGRFTGPGTLTVIPEPSSCLMLLGGLGALAGFRRRGRR